MSSSVFERAVFAGNIRGMRVDKSLPQLVFWGRSNVGKSSLINAIAGTNKLVRTSKSPGCTQDVNFFQVGGLMYLVDLPGYGYSKAGKTVSESWFEHVSEYLLSYREHILRVFLLIDAEVGLKARDFEVMALLEEGIVPYQFLLTKFDKLKKNAQQAALESLSNQCVTNAPSAYSEVLITSVREYKSILHLRSSLIRMVQDAGLAESL